MHLPEITQNRALEMARQAATKNMRLEHRTELNEDDYEIAFNVFEVLWQPGI